VKHLPIFAENCSIMKVNIADLREDYRLKSLDFTDVTSHPFPQFDTWFQEAVAAQILEPNAMVLATVADGKPSARVVLLKGLTTEGFVFFTNYTSRKGIELAANPYAALCFNWLDLQRQVRIEGIVEKISEAESDAYFNSRPFGSRIGAWASPQSQIIPNRSILEENVLELTKKYEKRGADTEGVLEVPRPSHWGGYILLPTLIEFWQGRSSRLHDRICYQKTENGAWEMVRLAP
jgi:pyridoxamine 5'-phosphate oxidase